MGPCGRTQPRKAAKTSSKSSSDDRRNNSCSSSISDLLHAMGKLKKKGAKKAGPNAATTPSSPSPDTSISSTPSKAPASTSTSISGSSSPSITASPIFIRTSVPALTTTTAAVVTVLPDHSDSVSILNDGEVPVATRARSLSSSASSIHTYNSAVTDLHATPTRHSSSPSSSTGSPSALAALRNRLAADKEAQLQHHHKETSEDAPAKLKKKRPTSIAAAATVADIEQPEEHEPDQEEQPSNGAAAIESIVDEGFIQESETIIESLPSSTDPETPVESDTTKAQSRDSSHSSPLPKSSPSSSEPALVSLALAPPRLVYRVAADTTHFAYSTTVRAVSIPFNLAYSCAQIPITVLKFVPVVHQNQQNHSKGASTSSPSPPIKSQLQSRLSRPSEDEGTFGDDDEFGPKGLMYRTVEAGIGLALASVFVPVAATTLVWGAWTGRHKKSNEA